MRRLSGWAPTRCFYLYLASRILREPVKSSISRRVSEKCDPAARLDGQPVVAPSISQFLYHVNDLTAIEGDSALHAPLPHAGLPGQYLGQRLAGPAGAEVADVLGRGRCEPVRHLGQPRRHRPVWAVGLDHGLHPAAAEPAGAVGDQIEAGLGDQPPPLRLRPARPQERLAFRRRQPNTAVQGSASGIGRGELPPTLRPSLFHCLDQPALRISCGPI